MVFRRNVMDSGSGALRAPDLPFAVFGDFAPNPSAGKSKTRLPPSGTKSMLSGGNTGVRGYLCSARAREIRGKEKMRLPTRLDDPGPNKGSRGTRPLGHIFAAWLTRYTYGAELKIMKFHEFHDFHEFCPLGARTSGA